jgi:O-antigen/teichoic acid export membrane protein
MVSQVTRLGGIGLGVLLKMPLTYFIAVSTLAFALRIAVGVLVVRRAFYAPSFRLDWARIRGLVAQGIPFAMAMFGILLYGRVGILMLQAMASSTDVAFFNVGYMLSQPLGFISTALSMSAFPVLARYAQESAGSVRAALRKTTKYQFLVTLPIVAGLFVLSERVVPVLFRGQDFARASVALRFMSLGLTLIFLNLMARYVLTAMDRQRTYLRAVVTGLVVNAGLCLALIPRFGFIGACIAFLGAETAILIVCQRALTRFVPLSDMAREAYRPLLAAVGMAAVIVAASAAPLLVLVALGAAVYAALLLALKVFTPRELEILRGVYVSFRLPGSARLARADQSQA